MLAGNLRQPLRAEAGRLGNRLAGTQLNRFSLLVGEDLPLAVVAPRSAVR